MKKLLAVLLTVCLLSTLWTVFAVAEDKPTIVVNTFAQEHEKAMYEEVIKQFEEENNCIVDFRVSGDQYWPELEASLTAGNAPDVFYLGVGDVRKRVWTGAVAALDDYLDVSTLGTIWPEALNLSSTTRKATSWARAKSTACRRTSPPCP